MKVYIIAEAGVNHNGEMNLAKQLIDVAVEAGANAVKFQTFRADNLVSRRAPKAAYQMETTDKNESQFEMIQKLELTESDHEHLISYSRSKGIEFLSTPFDSSSLRLLTQRFGITTIKVPSGEITNAPFLLEVARAASKVILSTGMCTLAEVEFALGVLAFGFITNPREIPGCEAFIHAYSSDDGQKALRDRVTLLHCTTEYPAPFNEVNLRAMDALTLAFALPVGYSDHTPGIHIATAAVARGAIIIEKHFTMDRNLPGPDHLASLEPDEFRYMVLAIRQVELAVGHGIKLVSGSEWKNREVARKSLVAAHVIRMGETFSKDNVAIKRPGTGLSPSRYWEVLGKKSGREYQADELIDS